MFKLTLSAPLGASWAQQMVRLQLPDTAAGAALALQIDGHSAEFQYTGRQVGQAAEILVRLGLEKGQRKTLEFIPAARSSTDLFRVDISLAQGAATIGPEPSPLTIPSPTPISGLPIVAGGDRPIHSVAGPFASFAGNPLESSVSCAAPFEGCTLTRTSAGPLFIDYELVYRFALERSYRLTLRCFRQEPIIEVGESIALGMDARLHLAFNPSRRFDQILSHHGFEFEGDGQPITEALAHDRPKDVLCRLQMPPLGEFTVPNNRGWFAFFNEQAAAQGHATMLGMMGLYGARWERAVENIMPVHVRGGRAELSASLNGGARHWLLYAGPFERGFTKEPERRFVFHRLIGEFNACRLDEHLDLNNSTIWDASCWDKPGVLGADFRQVARRNAAAMPALKRYLAGLTPADRQNDVAVRLLAALEPDPALHAVLHQFILDRCRLWVRQFQGYRRGEGDYFKNVIGFSRRLRALLLAYELLRRDGVLSPPQVAEINAYFAFCARRILDEGRWPHSKTWKHPDHPDSTRDLYTFPGEHKPDKLVWTNCLPNFQSDPMCALAHLGALLPDHPDAGHWVRFALDDIDRQLDAYCGPNGAWEESINYAAYTLSYFVITFRILKNRLGIDYFQDPRMRRFAAWIVRFLAPLDKRWNSHTWPAIGNSGLPTGGGEYLLAYAGELQEGDELRDQLIAAYQRLEPVSRLMEHYPLIAAVMSPLPDPARGLYPLPRCVSECMPEIGVAMRHDHGSPKESYLFQKIGFAKDHYESDETSFNWYAKGTPLTMDYGTYTGDVMGAKAHNLIEIPDAENLRRGFLAATFFSDPVDFTRCEVPIHLKLSHGHVRSFAEVDGPPRKPLYFYIGDETPAGPKTWVTRMLLFVKPDYLFIFDRVFGAVPHRYNLHVTAPSIQRQGSYLHATGRFDLDLLGFVQHPTQFEMETGELVPTPERFGHGEANPHRQAFARVYNKTDNLYRTVLFAKERGHDVKIEKMGQSGVKVVTPEYTDYAFANDELVRENADGVGFVGRAGWIRKAATGQISACMIDGDEIAAFGSKLNGRGPWTYNLDGRGTLHIRGTPRPVRVL